LGGQQNALDKWRADSELIAAAWQSLSDAWAGADNSAFELAVAEFMATANQYMPNLARSLRVGYGGGNEGGAGDVEAVRNFMAAISDAYEASDGNEWQVE